MKMQPSREIGALVSMLLAATPIAQATQCAEITGKVDQALWRNVADGLDMSTIAVGSAKLSDLTMIRVKNGSYGVRAFDLRDTLELNQRRGFYAPPMFSLGELAEGFPTATLIASAGFTKSYSEPFPAGYLRIGGVTRNRLAPKDKVLDGVVCMTPTGQLSILDGIKEGSPTLREAEQCHEGFQAGPILLTEGTATSGEFKLNAPKVPRVALAETSDSSVVVLYSNAATIAALRCAVGSPALDVRRAINLQGDALGGIALGSPFSPLVSLGNMDATIASAVIIEQRTSRAKASR